jgi:hypothetical protein
LRNLDVHCQLNLTCVSMKDIAILLIHLLTTVAKLLGPGGAKAIIAENLLLKQQLLVVTRSRRRAPDLSTADRFLMGFWSLFLRPGRIAKIALSIRPSTLLNFHQCLVRRKYRRLFSPKKRTKPGVVRKYYRSSLSGEHCLPVSRIACSCINATCQRNHSNICISSRSHRGKAHCAPP